jgi:hypothetical protein
MRWTLDFIASGILRLWQISVLTLQCQGAKLLGNHWQETKKEDLEKQKK